jgi:hypothetical protein
MSKLTIKALAIAAEVAVVVLRVGTGARARARSRAGAGAHAGTTFLLAADCRQSLHPVRAPIGGSKYSSNSSRGDSNKVPFVTVALLQSIAVPTD